MEENLTQEIDIRDIFRILNKRIKILIIIPLLAVIVSGLVSYFYLTPMYMSSTTMMLWKEHGGGEVVYQDIQFNRQLVRTYQEIAKSRLVAEETIKRLNMTLTAGQLSQKIEVSLVRDTEVISISVTDSSPERAAIIANAVADVFQEQVPKMIKMDNIKIIDAAFPDYSPIAPRPRLNMAVAGVLGVMVAVGLAFILEYLDDTVKTPEEVHRLLGLNVLGTIPILNEKD
ncbi:MAG: Wzz/FepE/Etk N-terminal domain-containing protein [Bacillota bacterium]|nr:Wzz/FepE/Etk N-terminal domain-containing protein [Bacillota bacterium]